MASVSDVVKRYQEMFAQNLNFKFSCNKPTLGPEGVGNMIFYVAYLCQNKAKFLDFLREIGILKTVFICHKCNQFMKLMCKQNSTDIERYVFKCKKDCKVTRSIRYGSMFSCSRLSMEEAFLMCLELIRGTNNKQIIKEYGFSHLTLSQWRQLINTVVLDYVLLKSEIIGGEGKIVDLVETRVHKRRYQNELNVIAGIERDTGRLFFASVHNKSAETYQWVIEKWIEKGTSICSYPWDAPDKKIQLTCDYLRAMHDVVFLDPKKNTSPKSDTTRSNIRENNSYGAFLVFKKSCDEKNENVFNAFLEIAREVDWVDSKFNMKAARQSKDAKAQKKPEWDSEDAESITPD